MTTPLGALRAFFFGAALAVAAPLAMLPWHVVRLSVWTADDYAPDPWDRPYTRIGFQVGGQ